MLTHSLSLTDIPSIIPGYTSGVRNFQNTQLPEIDLQGVDLSHADLAGANLRGANLAGVNLSGANLWGANLSYANLRGANLERAKLKEADLRQANLTQANLSAANLNHAQLMGANLTKACLNNASLLKANLAHAHLNQATLIHANLQQANLCAAYLTGANLQQARLSLANLNEAWLCGINSTRTKFYEACYNDYTRFEQGFDPVQANMLKTEGIKVEEFLQIANHLCQLSDRYLGHYFTIKLWQSACPHQEWRNQFTVDDSATIIFNGSLTQSLNPAQLQWSRKWVNNFIQSCSSILKGFSDLIDAQQLEKWGS